jgi:hypothetical protein
VHRTVIPAHLKPKPVSVILFVTDSIQARTETLLVLENTNQTMVSNSGAVFYVSRLLGSGLQATAHAVCLKFLPVLQVIS